MYDYRKTIIPIFVIFILGVILLNVFPLKKSSCANYRKMFLQHYKGFVKDKYYDLTNHYYPIVELENNFKINFIDERSEIFYQINTGDFIEKKTHNDTVTILKSDTSFIYVLDYGCE